MALSKSNLLIRDYENIRQVIRNIYIYGCFTRDDFIEMGMSGRKYDNEQRRISSYLPCGFLKKRRFNKKVLTYCEYCMTDGSENYLAETFRNKSFTMLDFMAYFYILPILSESEPLGLIDILGRIPNVNDEAFFTKDNLRIKLDELVEYGLVKVIKKGRNIRYTLYQDIWIDFSNDELLDICFLLEFLKNIIPLEMPYYYLQKKIRLYLFANRGLEVSNESTLQFKHNHIFNVMDNEILLDVLKAIYVKAEVEITITRRDNEVTFFTIPLRIIHDSIYGRQYLLCYSSDYEKISSIRIDKILKTHILKTVDEIVFKKALEMLKNENECWCTAGLDQDVSEVKIEFWLDEYKEKYILNRIEREGHNGKIEKISEGRFLFTLEVRDPVELIPWIRSFAEKAKVISSKDGILEKALAEDLRRAVLKYESL